MRPGARPVKKGRGQTGPAFDLAQRAADVHESPVAARAAIRRANEPRFDLNTPQRPDGPVTPAIRAAPLGRFLGRALYRRAVARAAREPECAPVWVAADLDGDAPPKRGRDTAKLLGVPALRLGGRAQALRATNRAADVHEIHEDKSLPPPRRVRKTANYGGYPRPADQGDTNLVARTCM
jgi:hypothetical protein